MDANLFAQPARVTVGGEAVKQDPEQRPAAGGEGRHVDQQRADRREVADEGEPGPQSDRDPRGVLGALQRQLARRHRILVELHAFRAIALDLALDPHENLGVDGLRARIAAPEAPADRGEEKERERRDDQNRRQVDDVLRPQHHAEDIELARSEVEQQRLATVPLQPRQSVEHDLGRPDRRPAPLLKDTERIPDPLARIDLLALRVQPYLDFSHWRALDRARRRRVPLDFDRVFHRVTGPEMQTRHPGTGVPRRS